MICPLYSDSSAFYFRNVFLNCIFIYFINFISPFIDYVLYLHFSYFLLPTSYLYFFLTIYFNSILLILSFLLSVSITVFSPMFLYFWAPSNSFYISWCLYFSYSPTELCYFINYCILISFLTSCLSILPPSITEAIARFTLKKFV